MRWLVLCCILLVVVPVSGTAQMRVAFSNAVLQDNLISLGVNLSKDAWHTGAIFTKERVRNGSFEGVLYRQITYGSQASPSTYQDGFAFRGWKDVLSKANVRFLSGPARGVVQLTDITETTVDDEAESKRVLAYHFTPRKKAPEPYDALMFEAELPTGWLGQHGGDWWVFTEGQAHVRTVQGDTPPADTGEHVGALEAANGTATILAPLLHAMYANPNGEWLLRFWSKGEGTLSLFLGDLGHQADNAPLHRLITLRPEWTYHELYLPLSEYPHELLALGFAISNGSVLLDGISMQHTNDKNPTAFRDSLLAGLRKLAPGTLRLHQIGGSSLDNWLAPSMRRFAYSSSRLDPPPTGEWPSHPQEIGRAKVHAYGLHEFLTLCREVGSSPWLCLPGVFTEDEARNVIEYLAGPVTSKYGMLRSSLGQVTPWTKVFSSIHLEIGNEAWNTIPPYLLGGYSVKGEYWQRLFSAMRSSQWYSPSIILHAGGQAVNTWLNTRIAKEVSKAHKLAIGPYLLHELNATIGALPERELLNFVRGAAHYLDTLGYMADNSRDVSLPLSVYEVNYHVTGGDASAAPRNVIASSMGGAVILTDWCLRLLANHGCTPVNLFTLQHPYQQTPSGKVELWGLALSFEQGAERYRPLFLAATLVNRMLHGQLMQLHVESVPQEITPYQTSDGELITAPLVTVYGAQQGNMRRLLICNMSMRKQQQVMVESLQGDVSRTEVSGESFLSNNEVGHSPQVLRIQKAHTTGSFVLLPPASLTLLEWEVAHE